MIKEKTYYQGEFEKSHQAMIDVCTSLFDYLSNQDININYVELETIWMMVEDLNNEYLCQEVIINLDDF